MVVQSLPIPPKDILDAQILQAEGYVESLFTEGKWLGGFQTIDDAMASRATAASAAAAAMALRNDFEITYSGFFSRKKQNFDENYAYWRSQQWTERDINNLIADGLPPYVSNLMKRQADTTLGEQRARETEWRAIGRNPEADRLAEFQNHYLRSVSQINNWPRIKSYVFRDGFIGGTGVASALLDPADPKGNVLLQHHRPQEFMWHLETAENGSLEGSKYIWRGQWTNRTDLLWQFPQWARELRDMSSSAYTSVYPWLDTLMRPTVPRTTGSSAGSNQMTFDPLVSRMQWSLIFKREFYHRRMLPKWRVSNGYTATHYDCDTEEQASYIYIQLCEIWKMNISAQTGQPSDSIVPRIAQPRFVQVPVIDQQIWAGDILLAVNTSDDDVLPYHFFNPEYQDGNITSPFQHGKDMQRLRNVVMTTIHKRAATYKPKLGVNMALLGDNMTERKIDEMLMSESKAFKFNAPNLENPEKAIFPIAQPGHDNTLEAMIGFTTSDINYTGGGLNAIGLTENSGESGRAITARTQTAAIALVPVMEEFESFDKEVGDHVLYLAQFTDPNAQWLAINPEGRPEFASLAEYGIQDVPEMKFTCDVVQTLGSATEREGEVNRLGGVLQQLGPNSPLSIPIAELMMKKMDIDQSDRQYVIESAKQREEFGQQIQTRQQQLAEAESQKKWELAALDRQIKIKELELEEMKIKSPNVSLNIKPMETPPALMAEIWNTFNKESNADPMGVAADQATHAQMKQMALDVQQKHRNELLTPSQKKIDRMKALSAGSKIPASVPSAEDTANRQNKAT